MLLLAPITASAQSASDQPPSAASAEPEPGHLALDEAYRRLSEQDLRGARAAFEAALRAGANAQVVWLELGELARQANDVAGAAAAFRKCAGGPDRQLAGEAEQQLAELGAAPQLEAEHAPAKPVTAAPAPAASADALLDRAYALKSSGDAAGAEATFRSAERAGADPQLIALELAYLALDGKDKPYAKLQFERAARGRDPARRAQAERELSALADDAREGGAWGDLYAEAYGWTRRLGANHDADLVPTLRLRGFAAPFPGLDFYGYLIVQVTRDTASRSAGPGGLPVIYADDAALFGQGFLARFWNHQLGVFAQLGPAFELLANGGRRVFVDARAGAQLGLETDTCWPIAHGDVRVRIAMCEELYAELTYVNRYQNNVFGFARGRASLGLAVTGPIEWELASELRVAKDKNQDYYNNFIDAGLGLRLRLLAPIHLDVMLAPHVGSYFGESHIEPAPSPLHYLDLRLQAATYIQVGP